MTVNLGSKPGLFDSSWECVNAYDPKARLLRIKAYIGFLNKAEPEKLLHIFSAEPALELEDLLPIEYKSMAERTLKELGAPRTREDPLCIVFSELENPLKLNSGFLNLLPKFYGNAGYTCSTLRRLN
ncbi:uncharacterized protein LOC110716030 isoform X2 [Chenopodium quinoa]|uniref:uncharacterized protein LOC110716030 isoform X2 n=1 Tax=Chenopodium quinoa TaxID=63459 RepID=UPI000B7831A3|nr:uncharacterized protein LOC110716030 isoform X2 [Chenopodium quinoa]